MSPFWNLASRMLRRRGTATGAVVMAFISATGLGAGLLGLVPVLNNILGEAHATLPDLARTLGERAPRWLLPSGTPPALIDRLPTGRFDAVLWIVLALGAMTLFGAAANFLHAYLSLTLTTRVIAEIRRTAFKRLVRLPLGVMVAGHGQDLSSRIVTDTNILARGLQALTSKAVAQVTRGAVALLVAFLINWRLSAVMVLVAPVLAFVIRKTGKRIRKATRGALRGQARLLEDASEVTRGFRVMKAFTAERAEVGRFSRHNREVLKETLRLRTAQAIASPLLETITIFALGGLALIAAKAIIEGKLDATEFLVALGSLGMAGAALRPLAAVIQDIQVGEAAAARIDELLNHKPEERRTRGRPTLPRHRESIAFEDVSFAYTQPGENAVDRVTLRIDHGETVAFVGPNGCGKTTLLSLIPRLLVPTEGRLLIDSIDAAAVSLRSLRRHIGVVAQETILFRGTIASNIAYGSHGATRAQIEEAARRAHAHGFILQQPKGYDTEVGDAGLTLSGGQRQRLAIARALLRDPAILIMDEATSMIDSESEAQIAAAVNEMAGSRTILIVAHRLTTVMSAQRIVVMDRGRILDTGSHGELLDRCGLYRDLVRHQMVGAPA
jgi:ABC-type multidrug transport system fused ATPase/permease subunit